MTMKMPTASRKQILVKRTAAGRGTSSFFSSKIIGSSLTEEGPISVRAGRAGAIEADDVGVIGSGGGGGD